MGGGFGINHQTAAQDAVLAHQILDRADLFFLLFRLSAGVGGKRGTAGYDKWGAGEAGNETATTGLGQPDHGCLLDG
jgi:hypothetical protein